MSSREIYLLYISSLCLQVAVEVWLSARNLRRARRKGAALPERFAGHFDPATFSRSLEYSASKAALSIVSTVYSGAILLAFVSLGWFGVLDSWVRERISGQFAQGVVFVLSLSFVFSMLQLPLSYYSTFRLEQRFGFNRTTLRVWLGDLARGALVSAVLLSGVVYVVLLLMGSAGDAWWVYAFLFVAVFQLFLVFIYPIAIAPIFNRFSPIEDGELRHAISGLCDRLDYTVSGVFVMDGSRRSGHANAHFTGFGRNKRIVLFDTLISSLKLPEIVAVLAHEVGHAKKGHIKKAMLLSFACLLPSFWLMSRLMLHPPFFEAFGFDLVSHHAALVIFAFASGPFTYLLTPLFSWISRAHEYQADAYAVDATGGHEHLRDALLAMSKNSLSNVDPDPIYSFFHYSHPTLSERLAAMEKLPRPKRG